MGKFRKQTPAPQKRCLLALSLQLAKERQIICIKDKCFEEENDRDITRRNGWRRKNLSTSQKRFSLRTTTNKKMMTTTQYRYTNHIRYIPVGFNF